MALQLSANVCQSADCKTLQFSETTREYNALTNITGWGTPNIDIGDVITATLSISGDNITTPIVFDLLTEGFPTIDENVIFEIANIDLLFGESSPIQDGFYTFLYEITTSTESYNVSVDKLLYCVIECRVNSMLANLQISDPDCHNCKNEKTKQALLAWTYLQSLKLAARCGDRTRFLKILKILNKITINQDCGC